MTIQGKEVPADYAAGDLIDKPESREKGLRVILSFDVGATNLRGAVVSLADDDTKSITCREVTPTPQGDPQAVIDAIVQTGRSVMQKARASGIEPVGIGISFCGHFDEDNPGFLTWAGNLRLKNVEMGRPIQEALGIPVQLINDVSAAALAESRERKLKNLAAIFIGTGVGLGVIVDGQPAEKAGNRSDLIMKRSHSTYKPGGGAPCPMGCDGCFQSYMGGRSLELRASAIGIANDAAGLISKWREGDDRAKLIIDQALEALKVFIELVVKEFNVEKIIIGGTVADNLPELIGAANEITDVERAVLGGNAPLLGAAELAADSQRA